MIELRPSENLVAQLKINTGFVRQIFDRDYSGQVIYPDNATTVNVCIPNELVLASGELPLLIVVRIQKAELRDEAEADDIAIEWLKSSLPSRLEKSGYWNFFEHTWLNHGTIDRSSTKGLEFPVVLTQRLEAQATETLQQIRTVRDRFQTARERLSMLASENTAFGFAQSLGEGREAIQKISDILAASADYGGYTAADGRSAIRNYEELARRKVESNISYQNALNSLRRFAYSVSFPTTWHRRPN